jgi:hypothetical protein
VTMTRSRQSDLDRLSAPRQGVVTQRELVAAGFRHDLAVSEVRAGRWQRLLPGVYLRSASPPTLRQRCYAAVAHAGDRAVITGTAGCELRGISLPSTLDDEVTVVVPRTSRAGSSGFCHVTTTKRMPMLGLLQWEGLQDLRIAKAERCVADAIRRAGELGDARALATAAVRHKALVWDEVQRMGSRSGPGAGHLRRVVREVADGVRSPAEADVHETLLRAARRGSLPPYLVNPDLILDGVLLGSPDFWFVGLGLGDEVDSRQWHEETSALDRTLQRHDRFRGAGLQLNHTTPGRFALDRRAHVRVLQGLVAERRSLALPEPPGLVVLGRGPLMPHRTAWPQVDPSRWA